MSTKIWLLVLWGMSDLAPYTGPGNIYVTHTEAFRTQRECLKAAEPHPNNSVCVRIKVARKEGN